MSKEKFLNSVLKSEDAIFANDDWLTKMDNMMDVPDLECRIREAYEEYAHHTNKPRYAYISVLVSYLLFIACKMMKRDNTTRKPSLLEVCQNSYDDFIEKDDETRGYPYGYNIPAILTDLCAKYLDQKIWEKFLGFIDEYKQYDADFFAHVALNPFEIIATPLTVRALALEILNVQNGDKVMDLGCGCASFMTYMSDENKLARYTEGKYSNVFTGGKYYGYEISDTERAIAVLRANLLGVQNIGGDFISVDSDYQKGISDTNNFDKIFADYPRGLKYLPHNLESKGGSSDWAFNDWICKHLTTKGKAVAIMSNGAAWNTIDIKTRKEFVEKGLVEAVIALPAWPHPRTAVTTTMIVFSHGNKNVKMVEKIDYNMISTEEYVKKILEGLKSDTEYSKTVSIEELRDNDYVLNYNRYVAPDVKYKNVRKLGDFIVSIKRGISYGNGDLSQEKTFSQFPVQYLSLSNIKNGLIDDDLPYVLPDKETKSNLFLKENDLIISKSGQPYKIAVANPQPDQQIIPSGNMYVIELDTKRINPYYVKTFLESQQGKAVLNSRSNQATIINISREELQKLDIPVPSMDIQNKIAKAYLSMADEYKVCQLKLEDATNRLNSVFDDNYKD